MNISQQDFHAFRTMLERHSGIVLDEGKEYLVETRLAPLVRRDGGTLAELVRAVVARQSGALHTEVIDAMTTNETSFFRDAHPFEALRTAVVPQLLERNAASRRLSILSGASSTGQESYSVAMLLRTHFPQLGGWDVRILGTDLSGYALTRAREARYSQLEVNRGLPAQMLRWFRQEGRDFVVADELRRWCEFRRLNLVEPWGPMGPFDLVLLRNVLIYFDTVTKAAILRRLVDVTVPGGAVLLGASETTINLDVPLTSERHGTTTVFRTPERSSSTWSSPALTSSR